MADTGGINVEMNIGTKDASILARIRKHLNPAEHTIIENSLAFVVLVLFIVVIALAASHGGAGTPATCDQTCQLQPCLCRSGYVVRLTNLSANPCDDFYKYACGGASQVFPLNPSLRERTVITDVSRTNMDKVETILRAPVTRNTPDSYERKIKLFFSKCVDDFLIEKVRGSVMAMLLRPDFYVMNESTVQNFNLDQSILSAVKTYGVPVFFQYQVRPNLLDANRYTISIDTGGIGMPSVVYLLSFYKKQQEAYKTYIRSVAQFLVSDAEAGSVQNGADGRIEDFVQDVMDVETALANFTRTSRPDLNKPPLRPENQVSLSDMNTIYNGISWTSLFKQLFDSSTQQSTKVAVLVPDYLTRMTTYIKDTITVLYPNIYKRKLSNYINWQIIRSYTGDMSSSYVHARREFEASMPSGTYLYKSRFDYCFDRIRRFMLKGLNSLFVADHLVDQSKKAVDDIYKVLQTQLISGIDRLNWIDAAAKEKAKRKARAIVDKIGYSVRESEDTYLDDHYKSFPIESGDYLLEISINWQNYNRQNQASLLGTQLTKSNWTGATFDVGVSMSSSAELTIPAGILQTPFFTRQLPTYINYATIGQRLARELIKSIDATGQLTDENGILNPMWSADTLLSYTDKAKCINSTFSGLRGGPYMVANKTYFVDIGPIIRRHLRQQVAELDALRMAASAYQATEAAKTDLPLPLVHLDNRKAFFVSWAQTYCYTRDPLFSYLKGYFWAEIPEEVHVNGLLSMLPEFGQAFQCPAGSNMVRSEGGCEPIFYK